MSGLIPDWAAEAIGEEVARAPEWDEGKQQELRLIIWGASAPADLPGEAA